MCEKANSVTDFGNSWVVRVDECPDVIPEPPDPCEGDSDATREAEELCAIIPDRDGMYCVWSLSAKWSPLLYFEKSNNIVG